MSPERTFEVSKKHVVFNLECLKEFQAVKVLRQLRILAEESLLAVVGERLLAPVELDIALLDVLDVYAFMGFEAQVGRESLKSVDLLQTPGVEAALCLE